MRGSRLARAIGAGTLLLGVVGTGGGTASAAPSKAVTCFQALAAVHNRLAPIVEAVGARTSLRVGPWDPAGSNLLVGADYDAEVLTLGDGTIEMHLNCGTTRPVSRRQMRAAFRFLVLHEYTHILQRAYPTGWEFDPGGEHLADCAALMMMQAWNWSLPSGARQGSNGGCPDEIWDASYAWLVSIGAPI